MTVPATYTYLAVDLLSNNVLAELPLTGVSFSSALNSAGTLTGKMKISDPKVQKIKPIDSSEPSRTALFVDRDGVLVWGGVIWTRRYTTTDDTVEIGASEFWTYFKRRFVTTTKSYSSQDQLYIVRDLISWAQSVPGGNIGVQVGTETSGVVRDLTINSYELRPVGDAIEELSTLDGGFDFAIDVAYDATGVPAKYLRLGYPRRGRNSSDSGFVIEHPGDVTEFEWTEDGGSQATALYVEGAGEGSTMLSSVVSSPDMLDAGYPLLDAVVSYKDSNVQATLDARAREEAARSKAAITISKITIEGNTDPVFGSYIVGDDFRLRLGGPRFPTPVDTIQRVVGWTVTPHDSGVHETIDLTLGEAI